MCLRAWLPRIYEVILLLVVYFRELHSKRMNFVGFAAEIGITKCPDMKQVCLKFPLPVCDVSVVICLKNAMSPL